MLEHLRVWRISDVFYCKMCGGELEVNQDATVGQCQYCGTKQTIPKTDNEK